jgi:hypothetical protein
MMMVEGSITIDIRHSPAETNKSLKALLIRTGNRFTDRLLRVNPGEELNSGIPLESPANISQVLKQAAKAMKAEAMDPHTGRVDYENLAIKPPDPRVHFAISGGASSCPPIAFYDGPHLEA